MTKKIISVMLCVMMVLTVLPLSAMATTSITRVPVYVETPYAGNSVNFYAEIGDEESESCHVATYFFTEGVINGVLWEDVTDDENEFRLMEGDEFIEGHEYRVTVYVTTNRGYEFEKDDESGEYNCWAGVNDEYSFFYYEESTDCAEISRNFTCEADKIRILGASATVDAPVAGRHPDFSATLPDGAKYEIDHQYDGYHVHNGVMWKEAGSEVFLEESSTFKSGVAYEVAVFIKPLEGYAFGCNNFQAPNIATINASVNGVEAEINGYADQCSLKISFDGATGSPVEKFINTVKIYGTAPQAGAKPNYNVTVAKGAAYKVDTSKNDGNYVNGVGWMDEFSHDFISPGTKFQKGHKYRILVYLIPNDGYGFATEEVDEEDVTVTTIVYFNDEPGWVSGGDQTYILAGYIGTIYANIGSAKASGFIKSFDYTGKAIKQSKMKLTYNGKPLYEGEDYYLVYKNNKDVGTATVTIVGQGVYNGRVSLTYKIQLGKPKVKVSKATTTSVTLSWEKVTGAKYYHVYEYNTFSRRLKCVLVSYTGTSCTFKNKKAGKSYYYIVKAGFKKSSKKEVLSPCTVSNDLVTAYTLCNAPTVTGRTIGKRVRLSWNKCTGAKSYKVYEYNTKAKTYTRLTTTKSLSVTLSAKRGAHYYLVRAVNAAGALSAANTAVRVYVR